MEDEKIERIAKEIAKALKQKEENKKLWAEIKQKYPQLAEEIDFHFFEERCYKLNNGCGDDALFKDYQTKK